MTQSVLTFGDTALRLLLALATAGVTVGTLQLLGSQPDNFGRVVQGVLAGIGFLGAGVIVRRPDKSRVTGLTTAAAIWFFAGLAMLCGIGNFPLVGLLLGLAVALLVGGRSIERLLEGLLGETRGEGADDDAGGAPGS